MSATRLLSRPLLASLFVVDGIDALRNPRPHVSKAEPVAPQLAAKVGLPKDTELLVKANAATQLTAGALLGLGKFRRLAALVLAASLVPTTYAEHRFWESEDRTEREDQRSHFLKNVAILGGLLLEAVDTEGRPSLAWRSRRAARRAGKIAGGTRKAAKGAAAVKAMGAGKDLFKDKLSMGADGAGLTPKALKRRGRDQKRDQRGDGRSARRLARKAAKVGVAKGLVHRMAA